MKPDIPYIVDFNDPDISVFRVKCFGDTTLANARDGRIFIWGEDTVSDSNNTKCLEYPMVLENFRGIPFELGNSFI